ncbi:hypothetical protein [Rhodovulum sulfidophilum]|uniref:hypothetical protein n=1 Tax=Rhodovulum sulfidophilum TaxID=35806 RepID=UPI001F38600F|nr:hypothetical protein [Rhodovulum sulfidophilum]MCE8439564.1 hypothetical protein [Rhodovulum sulfidophilum]MCE8467945.1 hypothetical protein [Rhodovulum sulfidophilum]
MSYQNARNVRRESRTLVGRFRGGKLAPVMAVPVRGNEGGFLSQQITLELDPIAGRMITPITCEFISVFNPVQAIDAIKDPEAAYAGMTEVLREKLLSGNPLFDLEPESEISQRCGVNPRSIGGVKKVNEIVRLGHNAAVNFLRQRKYVKARQVLHSNTAITPALISQTVLDRLNGVLDPEDRVNGAIRFDGQIPVKGLAVRPGVTFETSASSSFELQQAGETERTQEGDWNKVAEGSATGALYVREDPLNSGSPAIYADLGGAAEISLSDFYNAETMDRFTRSMRKIVDDNPQYGEEMALRWAHGLSVDTGKVPFIISQQSRVFGRDIVGATDTAGVEGDVMRSDMMAQLSFSVPIPRTELGGVIITFATIKPDETLSSQPHPYLSDVWGADNFVADELALDPVPVTVRELDSDCAAADESTVALYVGHNGLKRTYVHYGLGRQLDPETVENKTAVWQLEVPMSVTPESVIYPEELEHYPFADQQAEVCTYVINSTAVIQTPTIFGPTPVEELAILEDENVFGDSEE